MTHQPDPRVAENLPPSETNEPPEDRQIFRILRNIDLNLLTIFEAVYVHKGIVNAAKVLNITPSAISQSINKLRALFPDPLFIRKGQGVTPTAYATHLHQYISQGMEAFSMRWIWAAAHISSVCSLLPPRRPSALW